MEFCGEYVHNVDMTQHRPGAQALHRAASVIRVISAHSGDGLGIGAISEKTGLSRSTAHRLVSALEEEGFVEFDGRSGRWFLGVELFVFGELARNRFELANHAGRVLEKLSRNTGESAFLSVRRGMETVCLLQEQGSFPLRSMVLYEGIRLPLGVASAGLVLLAFMPDHDIQRYLDEVKLEDTFGASHRNTSVWERVRETRQRGYSVNPGLLVEGSWGLGAAVSSESRIPEWALSLTGVQSRFSPERISELGRELLDAAHLLAKARRSVTERSAGVVG